MSDSMESDKRVRNAERATELGSRTGAAEIRVSLLSAVNQGVVTADAKAVAVILVSGAIITFLWTERRPGPLHEIDSFWNQVDGALLLLSITLASVSLGLALFSCYPRLSRLKEPGRPLYFGDAQRMSVSEYQACINRLSETDELLASIDEEVHTVSGLLWKKYAILRWAIGLLIGCVIAISLVLFLRVLPWSADRGGVVPPPSVPSISAP